MKKVLLAIAFILFLFPIFSDPPQDNNILLFVISYNASISEVHLVWVNLNNKQALDCSTQYQIWRSDDPKHKGQLVGVTNNTEFTDIVAPDDNTLYFYQVIIQGKKN